MNLYNIANEYQTVFNQIVDAETGEINETAMEQLNALSDDVKNKGIAVASYIKNIEAERDAIDAAKKAMAAREARLDARIGYLTSYLQSNMERCGISELTCAYFAVKLKKCPVSVDITDETAIPMEFKKVKEVLSVDKLKIKEEILNGAVIPGAALKQNMRLEIK